MIEAGDSPNYMIPIFPRQRDVFYSSIPVQWQEIDGGCVYVFLVLGIHLLLLLVRN